jgi:2-phospho-L-lactate/phosphoenolpyruvate guanylyltransferase
VFDVVHTAVLVPVKSFSSAKRRLADHLSTGQRQRLARVLAEGVIAAATPLPVFVACDDEEVARWVESLGAFVSWSPGMGLNGAIDHGVDTITGKGFDHVVVAHGDLPLADGLANIAVEGGVVIVPDRRRDGTNVLGRPTAVELRAEYGAGSFARHLASAIGCGAPVTVRLDRHLSIDVDTIDDCDHPSVAPLLGRAGLPPSSKWKR